MTKKFPKNPFPNIDPDRPSKRNKKKVTEDFVHINLKDDGWKVYEAFQDIGTDRIITRNNRGIKSIRFVQIKARRLEENCPKFTLKPKDYPTDPRTVFLFYSDTTQDFIIFLVNDYFDLYEKVGRTSHFTSPSFKYCNNKIAPFRIIDGLKKDVEGKWKFGDIPLDNYINQKGVDRIKNTQLDEDIEFRKEETIRLKDFRRKYFFKFKYQNPKAKSNAVKAKDIKLINEHIEILLSQDAEEIENVFKKNQELIKQQDPDILNSYKKMRLNEGLIEGQEEE